MRNKSLVGAVGLLALLPGLIELPASAAGTTNVVTGVKVNSEGDFTRIIVTGTEAFRPALRSLGNRPGTLINIPGVWGRDNNGYVRVGRNGVGGVRYGALDEVDADGVSIVANTRGYRPYSTRASEGGKRWEIKLWRKAPSTGRRARAVSVAVAPQRIASATRRLSAAPLVSADGERRISLDFVGADINDVLKALAMQADVNIVTAADVKGNITVSLNRVTVPEALDMVARLSGYQYAKVGPAYVVGTDKSVAALGANAAEPAAEPVTEVIPYRFMQTAELGKALAERFPGMKLSNGNDEKSASKQRMLVLTDTPERVAAARTFVERLEQAISLPTVGAATEVYRVRYTSPTDLISILARLVPTVQVTLGPAQGFQSGSSGASAAFASSPAEGSGASAGAGGGAASTGGGAGTSNPAGAVNSGGAPNTLLLTGATSDIVRAREVLESIDVRAPQMVFEARVMDIGSTDFSRIGLSYDFSRGVNIGETDRETPTIEGIGARRPNFGAILRTPYSIGVNLDLLAQNGQARLLANPNISALDGQPAVVFIGDQIKYVIRQEVTPTGTNIQTETATVGITLKVTGKASPDGTITLYVHPEVSVISGFLTVGNGISLPQIATRFVDTTIRVRDGETIAIGGLIRESDITNIQKVPFLGDLPFLGQLFRRTEKNKSRSEVVVFLTSRVLKD